MQLTCLGKSLPLICKRQPSLHHKRRVYSAYTVGAPPVPSWVIGEAVPLDPTGYYYIRPHYQDTGSKQLYLIHRNKHREPAKMRRQRNMAQMKEQIKTSKKKKS